MYWIQLIWYFILISFLGWLFSCLYHLIVEKKFYNKGFLTLPFCPVYGASAVMCYLVLTPLTDNVLILFIGSTLLLSLFLVLSGNIGKKILGCKPWDFSDMRFHIGSYLTMPYALLLGAGGTFAVKMLIPLLRMLIQFIPDPVSVIVALSLLLVMLIDVVFSFVTIYRLKSRIKRFEDNTEMLGDDFSAETILELEQNYNLIFTDNLMRKRMTNAFPELRHSGYFKLLAAKLGEIKTDNMKEYTTVYEKKEDKPFAFGLCFEKLFVLFLLGSFLGTCIETVYALIVEGHFECRVGVVYGPFIPVYGGGAVLMTLVLYKLYKLSDTMVFIISAFLGAFFEYICSWGQETFLGTVSWDYSNMPLNIGGRTSLLYACFWGFLGLIWLRYLYPFASRQIEKIPKKQGSVVVVVLFIFMLYNGFITISAISRWNERVEGKPAANAFAAYLDTHYDDKRMEFLFPHMRNPESLKELKDGVATPDTAVKIEPIRS